LRMPIPPHSHNKFTEHYHESIANILLLTFCSP